jgi:ATP-dependent Clp protease ATP-binding subunit ClpB|tara:strand:- start:352 stop:783 length:432 start_codon:yes stop_codon:yes gene_type:complete
MTSNLGSAEIQTMTGEHQYNEIKQEVMRQVGQHFRPEFINRIDDSVVFHGLTQAQIRIIASIQTNRLVLRLKEKGISLVTSDRALDELGKIGFDPVYGARPLKREIQQVIENPIAKALLSAEYGEGDTIKVDVDDEGNFLFSS